MKKKYKIAIFVAIVFIVVGCLFSFSALLTENFDFSMLNSWDYVEKTHTVSESFTSIYVKTDTSDISFIPATDGNCKVVCHESEKLLYNVFVADSTLRIEMLDRREWHDYIGFSFEDTKMTIYLPETFYNSVVLTSDTGDISIGNHFTFNNVNISGSTCDINFKAKVQDKLLIKLSTGDIFIDSSNIKNTDLKTSTGDIKISSMNGEKATIRTSTGEVTMNNVILSDKTTISTSTGDVLLKDSDASVIDIETSTGDVTCRLLTGKIYTAKSDTGDIRIPDHKKDGGTCKIVTDTGDIKVTIK